MKRLGLNAAVWALACAAAAPFAWLACAAFKQGEDLFAYPLLPWGHFDRLTLDNFRQLFGGHPLGAWLVNSVFLAAAQTLLVTILSSLGGFALAKYSFRGQRIVMGLMLLTVLLPSAVILPSLYELMNRLGWIDTYRAILLPGAVSVLGMFLYRQAMLGVPDELLDAARLDGCGEGRLWWSIALPIVRPMTGAFVLLSFLSSWNAYLWPQIVLQDENRFTLPLGLANLAATPGARAQFGVLMAATLLSVAPVIALFALMQRELTDGERLTDGL